MFNTLRKSAKKLGVARLFFWLLSKYNNFTPEENILICAYPRSGSTWLAEIIHQIPHTAILYQPLHLKYATQLRELGFYWHQHIPENQTWPQVEEVFDFLFRGKLLNREVYNQSTLAAWLRADRLVIKFILANALLPWLTNRYNFSYVPIFLIRHPFAVVASQFKHPGWKNANITDFIIPEGRYNEIYLKHRDFLFTLKSKEEILTARWCLVNSIPLNSPHNNIKWMTLHYEHLLMNPDRELERIFTRWGIAMPTSILDRIQQPSATVVETTFLQSKEEQLGKWQNSFDPDKISKMCTVLDYFGIDCYNESIFPQVEPRIFQGKRDN